MSKVVRFLGLTAALTLAASLSAEPGGPGGPGSHAARHGRHPGHPILRAIDTDRDRTLSAAELAGASAAILTLDANGDGALDRGELRPRRPANAPDSAVDAPKPPRDNVRPGRGNPVMLALDANSDGDLSAAEIANATASLQALDANTDGQLTPDELRPLPPERPTE